MNIVIMKLNQLLGVPDDNDVASAFEIGGVHDDIDLEIGVLETDVLKL